MELEKIMISDDEIIKDCLRGKISAPNLLYKRYASKMLGVCMRYFKTIEEAEDVLQDGFIKVFSNLNKFRNDGSFEGWIRRIMINSAINNHRSNQKHYFHSNIDEIQEQISSDNVFFDDYSCDQLLKMIHELPTGYRLVFNLYEIEGYKHKEIGDMLNISLNTSKTQLMKARNLLKKKLTNTNY